MTPSVVQRLAVLAAIALVGVLGALALSTEPDATGSTLPQGVPQPAGTWGQALAAPRRTVVGRTSCGYLLGPTTLGVAHPVLPCDTKIYIVYNDTRVLTQVIDQGPLVAGREFDLTKALAERIGLHGTQPVLWSLAGD